VLISHLIKLFSTEDQTVLDPFCGSGSHGVAAIEAGRKFIGFEIEPKYYELSVRRITAAKIPLPTDDIFIF
jgi:site-specific DNA-methyltransferase (adenine-specific)